MSDWIPLNLLELARPSNPSNNVFSGSIVRVVMSPHDVPIAVRGNKDHDNNRFVIQFRYLDDEPVKKITLTEGFIAEVGKNSERLYGISFPHSEGNVMLQLESQFDESMQKLMQSSQITKNEFVDRNLKAAKQAVGFGREQLLPAQ